MERVTHREMRNNSGEILRRVAAGESIEVTNNGRVAAIIGPPVRTTLDDLIERGEARAAIRPLADLRLIEPRPANKSSAEILADVRGRW